MSQSVRSDDEKRVMKEESTISNSTFLLKIGPVGLMANTPTVCFAAQNRVRNCVGGIEEEDVKCQVTHKELEMGHA